MVADAMRAVAWVRGHAGELGIDPDRMVLAGGSAGGHLALLAAYGAGDPRLTPPDLAEANLRVCGVASLYGQVGVDTLYWHTSQDKVCRSNDRQPDWTASPSRALVRLFGANAARLRLQFMTYGGRCDWLVGGTPAQAPERYARLSALSYVRQDCPPTLLLHGTHDEMAPVTAVRRLQQRLEEAGAPVTAVYLPHTDHMFDLAGTRWSPAARIAIYALERFLAVLGSGELRSPVRARAPEALRADPASEPRP
jgi:acetyl esterase/lipase